MEAFDSLGFKLEEEGSMGYSFTYEGLNLLFLYNENDTNFLSIALPGIYEAEEGKVLQVCVLMEKINSTLKYVKAYLVNDSVWMFYERELIEQREQNTTGHLNGGEDMEQLISRMILRLEAGMQYARKVMAEIEDMENGPSDDETEEAAQMPDAEDLNDDNDE